MKRTALITMLALADCGTERSSLMGLKGCRLPMPWRMFRQFLPKLRQHGRASSLRSTTRTAGRSRRTLTKAPTGDANAPDPLAIRSSGPRATSGRGWKSSRMADAATFACPNASGTARSTIWDRASNGAAITVTHPTGWLSGSWLSTAPNPESWIKACLPLQRLDRRRASSPSCNRARAKAMKRGISWTGRHSLALADSLQALIFAILRSLAWVSARSITSAAVWVTRSTSTRSRTVGSRGSR